MTHYEIYSKCDNTWKFMANNTITNVVPYFITTIEEAHERMQGLLEDRYVRHWFIAEVNGSGTLNVNISIEDINLIESMVMSITFIEIEPSPELMMRKLRG